MSITARQLKSGKTVYDVVVYIGNAKSGRTRHCETVPTLTIARALEAELKAEQQALASRNGNMTLEQYISHRYWPIAVKRLAPSSLDTYEREIDKRIIPHLGDLKLREIDRYAIQTMLDAAPTSTVARKTVSTLKTILNECLHDGYIKQNPATANFALPEKRGQKRDNGLVLSTFAEIQRVLSIVDEHASISVQRIAYTGLLLGLRPEERYALRWSDFDQSAQFVTISRAITTASAKNGGNAPKATKTRNSNRRVPFHPLFADFLASQPRNSNSDVFIQGASGQHISPSTAQKRWTRFLDDNTDCPRVTIENMRHSFATAYLGAGGQIEVLSRILGHANISTTIDRYYRPDVDTLRADMLRITDI